MTLRRSRNLRHGVRSLRYRVTEHVHGAAMRSGLADYRAPHNVSNAAWTEEYRSGFWDYLQGIDQRVRYSILAGYAEHFDHRSILDVGCGSGILRASIDRLDFQRYVGVDPIPAAIEEAEALADERTEFIVGDVFSPQLEQFEIVICNEVLYYLDHVPKQLDRIRDLLTSGGHLLTSNISHPYNPGLYRLLAERFELVDAVEVSNQTFRGRRHRKISAYRRS